MCSSLVVCPLLIFAMNEPIPEEAKALRMINKEMERQLLEKRETWRNLCRPGIKMIACFLGLIVVGVLEDALGRARTAFGVVGLALLAALFWQTLCFLLAAVLFIVRARR